MKTILCSNGLLQSINNQESDIYTYMYICALDDFYRFTLDRITAQNSRRLFN